MLDANPIYSQSVHDISSIPGVIMLVQQIVIYLDLHAVSHDNVKVS